MCFFCGRKFAMDGYEFTAAQALIGRNGKLHFQLGDDICNVAIRKTENIFIRLLHYHLSINCIFWMIPHFSSHVLLEITFSWGKADGRDRLADVNWKNEILNSKLIIGFWCHAKFCIKKIRTVEKNHCPISWNEIA